jgi:hypothetical protein
MSARTDPARTLRLTTPRVTCGDVATLVAQLDDPLLTLGAGAYADLERECGSTEHTVRWLAALATQHGRVIGVNLPTGPDTSSTVLIPPAGWSRARVHAAVAAAQPSLAAAFGPATVRSA